MIIKPIKYICLIIIDGYRTLKEESISTERFKFHELKQILNFLGNNLIYISSEKNILICFDNIVFPSIFHHNLYEKSGIKIYICDKNYTFFNLYIIIKENEEFVLYKVNRIAYNSVYKSFSFKNILIYINLHDDRILNFSDLEINQILDQWDSQEVLNTLLRR